MTVLLFVPQELELELLEEELVLVEVSLPHPSVIQKLQLLIAGTMKLLKNCQITTASYIRNRFGRASVQGAFNPVVGVNLFGFWFSLKNILFDNLT